MSKAEERADSRVLSELMLVMGMIILLFLLARGLVWVCEILSLSYLFLERKIRHRPIESLGWKYHGVLTDLRASLPIIALVAVGIQFGVVFGSRYLLVPLFDRLEGRVSYLQTHFASFAPSMMFLVFVGMATLVEELIFRGFVQERVSWFYGDSFGIVIGSLLISLLHYSHGELTLVMADLLFVFLDSTLYGLIYKPSRSVLVSWIAHLSADLVGLCLLQIL